MALAAAIAEANREKEQRLANRQTGHEAEEAAAAERTAANQMLAAAIQQQRPASSSTPSDRSSGRHELCVEMFTAFRNWELSERRPRRGGSSRSGWREDGRLDLLGHHLVLHVAVAEHAARS